MNLSIQNIPSISFVLFKKGKSLVTLQLLYNTLIKGSPIAVKKLVALEKSLFMQNYLNKKSVESLPVSKPETLLMNHLSFLQSTAQTLRGKPN